MRTNTTAQHVADFVRNRALHAPISHEIGYMLRCGAKTSSLTVSLVKHAAIVLGVVSMTLWSASTAQAWAEEHHLITRVAIKALPSSDQKFLQPEADALAAFYCAFPDWNHVNQGLWGAGTGDPKGKRMPDNRREWEVSRYCDRNPVLNRGRLFPHAPPDSYEATAFYFQKASRAFEQGQFEDGARFAGVMLHYIQDSGSYPHMQPFHRGIRVKDWKAVELSGYAPRLLAKDAASAPSSASRRVKDLVEYTEGRLATLLAFTDVSLQQVKELCAKDIAPKQLLVMAQDLRRHKEEEWFKITLDVCLESSKACADVLHTLIHFTPRKFPEPAANPLEQNLVFNPSLEETEGDEVPAGWVQGWLDLSDRTGKAEWYRAGTHWGAARVHKGKYSVLVLWAPAKGLEWRQTWPKAVRVRPGEQYECSGWLQTQGDGGSASVGAQMSDSTYQTISTVECKLVTGDTGWTEVRFRVAIPEGAKWLRLILNSKMQDGAAWFDDLRVVRKPAKASGEWKSTEEPTTQAREFASPQ